MQVHRFGNEVAGWLGQGPTIYMTPKQAKLVGEALIAAALDIEAQPKFSASTFKAVVVPGGNDREKF